MASPPTTVQTWRHRSDMQDRSHTRHPLLFSVSALEEALVLALRQDRHRSLDDLTEVLRRGVKPTLSRSTLYRCVKRHGLSSRPPQPFASETNAGVVPLDVKHRPKLKGKRS